MSSYHTTPYRGRHARTPSRRWVGMVLTAGIVVAAGVWTGQDHARSAVGELFAKVTGANCTAETAAGKVSLTSEQMGNAATIAAVGQARGLTPRAVTIAIATAMQESSLKNLNHGDRDSLGLFQQRPSAGWGTPEQIQDPVASTGAFYDALAGVSDYERLPLTVAAQAVQRSAYPDAYAKHEADAAVLTSALIGEAPTAVRCGDAGGGAGTAPQLASVSAAVERELGHTPRSTGDGYLDLMVGAQGTARGWAVAHWAVARAAALGISAVTHDGRAWTPGEGWHTARGAATTVRITVGA